jgi:hypothetical protein
MRNASDGQPTRLYRNNSEHIRFTTNFSSAGPAVCDSASERWINNASTVGHDILLQVKRNYLLTGYKMICFKMKRTGSLRLRVPEHKKILSRHIPY